MRCGRGESGSASLDIDEKFLTDVDFPGKSQPCMNLGAIRRI
jgi:hypothetical protein